MRRMIRETFTVFIGLGALAYLFFPSLVPDFLPFIGWIDEGVATTILLSVFSYYGIDLTHLLGRGAEATEKDKHEPGKQPVREPRKRYARVPRSRLQQGNLTRDELLQYEIIEIDEQDERASERR